MIKSVTYLSEDKKSYELSDESDIQTLDTSVAEGSVARVTGKITAEYELRGGNWVKTAGGSGGGGSVEPLIVDVVRQEAAGLARGGWTLDISANDLYQTYVSGRQILIKQIATQQTDPPTNTVTKYSLLVNATASVDSLTTSYKFYVNTDDFSPAIGAEVIKMFEADAPTTHPFCAEGN